MAAGAGRNLLSRGQQARAILKSEGGQGMLRRAVRRAYNSVGASELDFPVELDDLVDSSSLNLPVPSKPIPRERSLDIGIVLVPPGPHSGGHTTLFRLVEALEAAGHRCVLFLYDRHHGTGDLREKVIRRSWPRLRSEIRQVDDQLPPMDAYIATAWPTAHVIASRTPFPTQRMYLVQDFEPLFYPAGSQYVLAEDTYRFGFLQISVGHMVAETLRSRIGVACSVVEYGCDTAVYQVDQKASNRNGVAFYARRDTPRRGFELGMLALERFSKSNPSVPIHVFGEVLNRPPFPVENHGPLAPSDLARLYNSVAAGLSFSFTNVSLATEEMLACGVIPVVNDSEWVRRDFASPYVVWSRPTPQQVAQALTKAVTSRPDRADVGATARSVGWESAKVDFVRLVESKIYAPPAKN